jgi:hypothetical protein
MALYHFSNVVTRDLLFYYDAANPKSWRGSPTTNILEGNLSAFNDIYGNSTKTIISPNEVRWINNNVGPTTVRLDVPLASLINGQTYGISAYVKDVVGTVSIDWCDVAVTGTSSLTNTSGRLSGTALRGTYDSTFRFVDINLTQGGMMTVYDPQVDSINYVTAYTPPTTSRSASQVLLDLTNLNTITATALTYQNNDTFRFDGSNDYLTISTFPTKPTVSITCEAWIRPTKPSITGTQRGAAISATNSMYLGLIDSIDGGVTYALHWANQTTASRITSQVGNVPNNRFSHIVGTYDGVTTRAYLNGVQIYSAAQTGTIPDSTYVIGTYGLGLQDAVHNFNGDIPIARIYSRALSAIEVAQNFNAMRGRYGL